MLDIKELFPIPVCIVENENIDPVEHNTLLDIEYKLEHPSQSSGHQILSSTSKYVLDDNDVPNTRKFIEDTLKEYAIRTLNTEEPLKILNSWCFKQQQHMPQGLIEHRHPNSIISFAYYIQASNNSAGLTLYKERGFGTSYVMWDNDPDLMHKNNDNWSWEWQTIAAATGRLILFPSWMRHSINGAPDVATRCALSGNTWFVNPIGNKDNLTYLKL